MFIIALGTFIVTTLIRNRFYPNYSNQSRDIVSIWLTVIILVMITLINHTKIESNQPITDAGKACFHSLMCQGSCWYNTWGQVNNKIFVLGSCGTHYRPANYYQKVIWGIRSSINLEPYH
jgi:hypothetical protein